MSFVQNDERKCYCCGKKGHISPDCPEVETQARNKWAIRKVEQHMLEDTCSVRTNNNRENETTTDNNDTINEWSGLQICHHEKQETWKPTDDETILLDTGLTSSLFRSRKLVGE